jgi:PhnB protein
MSRYPPVTPHLAVRNAAKAIDFYIDAFSASERIRYVMPDGTVAHGELSFGDGLITVGEAVEEWQQQAPDPDGPVQAAVTFFVPDVDTAFDRAVKAGARPVSDPADQFHGDRTATVRCPFGHRWIIATHLRDLTDEELQTGFRRSIGVSSSP